MAIGRAEVIGIPLLSQYQILTGVTFPFAYQIDRNIDKPDWLFLSFGRFIDANLPINADCGIRVYPGLFASPGVILNNVWRPPSAQIVWCGTCDVAQSIPWGKRSCQLVIEFYRAAAATGANSSVEFNFTPYKGN